MSSTLKISIVTPSYNQGEFLEETIDSILSQNYSNLEYIIIDGGSSDNSLEIIKKYAGHLHYWVSEKDNGQSDAINKGIAQMTGDVFNWINSDDVLLPGSLKMVGELFKKEEVRCVKGGLKHIVNGEYQDFNVNHNHSNPLMHWCDPVVNQQSTFYASEFIHQIKGVNEVLHYSMDCEIWLKFLGIYGLDEVLFVQDILSGFRLHKDAKTSLNEHIFRKDIANILMSVAESTSNSKVNDLLSICYQKYDGYNFGQEIRMLDSDTLNKMALYFMIKWHRFPESKEDLRALEFIRDNFDQDDFIGDRKWWQNYLQNFSFKNRLKRRLIR